jgi:hypothetical protein
MGGLIDLKTNLRSFYNGGGYTLLDGSNYKPTKDVPTPDGFRGLKYGRDLPGGGSSNQPYVTSPISNGLGFNTPDFFLRQGALQSALVDTARLTSWFGDSINGILFTTKQNALERMNPAIPGGLTRVYNPLNTIAQVGLLPLNIHLNKQGILGANFGYAEGGRDGYYYFTLNKSEQDNVSRLSLLFDTKIANTKQLSTRTADQRLFNISRDPEYSISYNGGPGSIGGIGRTRIPLAGDGSNSSRDRTTTYKLSSQPNYDDVYTFDNELFSKQAPFVERQNSNLSDFRTKINDAQSEANLLSTSYETFNRENKYGTSKTVYRVFDKTLLNNPNKSIEGHSDTINRLGVLFGNIKQSQAKVDENVNKDLISFYFEVLNPKKNKDDSTVTDYIFFRAYITDLGDSYKADWQNYKYVGRAENFYKYGGFGRDISLSFTIYAHTRAEMLPLYQKLNHLVGVTAPTYSDQGFMMGNILKITVGDYLKSMPGVLTSISLKPSFEGGWDINRDQDGNILKFGDAEYVGQLPRLIDVSMNFTPIHNFAPEYGQKFISPDPARRSSSTDDIA